MGQPEIAGLETQGLPHGKKGIENQFLGYHSHQAPRSPVVPAHVLAMDGNASGGRPGQSGQTGNQGGFAGPVGAQQAEEFPGLNVQGYPVQGGKVAETLDHRLKRDRHRHGETPLASGQGQ